MRFAVFSSITGYVLRYGDAPADSFALQAQEGEEVIAVPDNIVDPQSFKIVDGLFVAIPPPPAAPVLAPSLSRIAYQRLFTQGERIAIRASTDPIVVDFRELAALAETIELADADVVGGTHYLEHLGLVGVGRAAVVLAGISPA